MDLLAVESVAGALGYGLFGHLFAGECDQCLAAALSAEVVQNENGIWLELQARQNQTVSGCMSLQLHRQNSRGSPQASGSASLEGPGQGNIL